MNKKTVVTVFLEADNSLIEVSGKELTSGDDRFAWVLEDIWHLMRPILVVGAGGFRSENRGGDIDQKDVSWRSGFIEKKEQQ